MNMLPLGNMYSPEIEALLLPDDQPEDDGDELPKAQGNPDGSHQHSPDERTLLVHSLDEGPRLLINANLHQHRDAGDVTGQPQVCGKADDGPHQSSHEEEPRLQIGNHFYQPRDEVEEQPNVRGKPDDVNELSGDSPHKCSHEVEPRLLLGYQLHQLVDQDEDDDQPKHPEVMIPRNQGAGISADRSPATIICSISLSSTGRMMRWSAKGQYIKVTPVMRKRLVAALAYYSTDLQRPSTVNNQVDSNEQDLDVHEQDGILHCHEQELSAAKPDDHINLEKSQKVNAIEQISLSTQGRLHPQNHLAGPKGRVILGKAWHLPIQTEPAE